MAAKKGKKKRSYGRGSGGGLKDIIDGGLAGAGGQIAQRWLGAYGHPAATLAVGWWRKNTVLKTEGARELGALLATQLPFIGGGESPYAGRNY